VTEPQASASCCELMVTVWLAKMANASTWMMKSASDVPDSGTGSGLADMIRLGVAPPVPPVPPVPVPVAAPQMAL
jgi:hypothetical protein